jgi:xylan 1,4-beta-xylosidase
LDLQKAGHGSLVESTDGEWYLAHLGARPVGTPRRCILGRETALQNIVWPKGDWPRLANDGNEPASSVKIPGVNAEPYVDQFTDHFAASTLNLQWNTLREPWDSTWLSLEERPGFLRLRGRCSLQSLFDQSLVGFRLLHHQCSVTTRFEFFPISFQQCAGLVMYYNTSNFYYAYITADEHGQRELRILACDNRRCRAVFCEGLPRDYSGAIELGAVLDREHLQFSIRLDNGSQQSVGPVLDATILSDDYPNECGLGLAFTGAYAALCAQDSSQAGVTADFDWFSYRATGCLGENVPAPIP